MKNDLWVVISWFDGETDELFVFETEEEAINFTREQNEKNTNIRLHFAWEKAINRIKGI